MPLAKPNPDPPSIQYYQGKPIIALNPGARFMFSFGIEKAKMVLANIEAIKAFVVSKGASLEPMTQENKTMEKEQVENNNEEEAPEMNAPQIKSLIIDESKPNF